MPTLDEIKTFDDDSVPLDAFPITPSDTTSLSTAVRAIRANTGGILDVTTGLGNRRQLFILAGETRFLVVTKVWAAGTTAGGLEGMR